MAFLRTACLVLTATLTQGAPLKSIVGDYLRDHGDAIPAVTPETLILATFTGNATDELSYEWTEMNDPVMGGESFGTWALGSEANGVFNGTVKNVSFLGAPGFCQAMTTSTFRADASAFLNGGILLTVRTTTPSYPGFKFAFNAIGAPRHHGGHEATGSYKTDFVPTSDWSDVFLPFDSFSSDWSDYTGECDTLDPDGYQHVCCDADVSPEVCPDAARLAQVTGFSIWAEGAEGSYHLEIKQIAATLSV